MAANLTLLTLNLLQGSNTSVTFNGLEMPSDHTTLPFFLLFLLQLSRICVGWKLSLNDLACYKCFGSKSGWIRIQLSLWVRIWIRIGNSNWKSGSRSGSRQAKLTHTKEADEDPIFHVLKVLDFLWWKSWVWIRIRIHQKILDIWNPYETILTTNLLHHRLIWHVF
jgi:hypothetical protein